MNALRAVGAAVLAAPLLALGQAYPLKPVRVILSSPAGGTPDVVARMVAPGLASRLGQPFVIDNRGGAGGLIATELTAKAPPDGYTLFIGGPGSLTIIPHLRRDMPYDTLRDLAPVSLIAIGPYLLITHPSVPVRTVKDLIALAKSEPGKLNYASAGNGAANHLAMEHFKALAGVNLTHVPYKGAPLAVTDLLAGNANVMMNSIPPVLAHIRAGRLRLLGVTSPKRASQLPEVPTVSEAGVPGYEFTTWFAMLAPARTPAAIVARLNGTVAQVLRTPELRVQLQTLGYELGGGSSQDFAAHLRAEMEKYARIVKASGARVD